MGRKEGCDERCGGSPANMASMVINTGVGSEQLLAGMTGGTCVGLERDQATVVSK